jgi:hypothetical protein
MVWAPPSNDWPGNLPATVPREMISSLHIDGTEIRLEKTKLIDMQRKFGGTIGKRGDAADFLAWLCLAGRDSSGRWVLWLMSGEIDGPSVGSFQWQRLEPSAQLDNRCQALPPATDVRLPIAIRLGIKQAAVENILGRPSARRGDAALYEHEHNLTIKDIPYTSENTVEVDFRDGIVRSIEVDKTTTD